MRLFTSSVVVAVLLTAWSAEGQTLQGPRSERPYRGLFGGDTANARELLTFSASFGAGYDSDIFADQSNTGTPATGNQGSTTFLTGSAQLGYSLSKSRFSFNAGFGSGAGHYPGLDEPSLVHHSANVGGAFQLARHTSLAAYQQETYQPFFFWSWLPNGVSPVVDPTPVFDPGTMTIADAVRAASLDIAEPVVADTTAASNAEYYLASETTVGMTQGLTRRMFLNLGYNYRRSDSKSGTRDFTSRSGSGQLTYRLARDLGLHGGYGYSINNYPTTDGSTAQYRGQNIDVGLDYNKSLSFSRRTTFSFATGTSIVNDGHQSHFNVIGNLQLSREIGRTWLAGVGYARSVSYLETFSAPTLTDTVSAGIGGLINRKTQFSANVGITRGNVGYAANNDFRSYFTSAAMRYAFTRYIGMTASYAFYRYTFATGIVLPTGVSPQTNRQSIQVSVDFWAPLMQRNRSANATR
jgi:hypothetical protein